MCTPDLPAKMLLTRPLNNGLAQEAPNAPMLLGRCALGSWAACAWAVPKHHGECGRSRGHPRYLPTHVPAMTLLLLSPGVVSPPPIGIGGTTPMYVVCAWEMRLCAHAQQAAFRTARLGDLPASFCPTADCNAILRRQCAVKHRCANCTATTMGKGMAASRPLRFAPMPMPHTYRTRRSRHTPSNCG